MIRFVNEHAIDDQAMFSYNPNYRSIAARLHSQGELLYFVSNGQSSFLSKKAGDWEWIEDLCQGHMSHERRAWFLVNGDTSILEEVRFEGEDLRRLRQGPVAIYMYEPLFLMNKSDSTFPWLPHREASFLSKELEYVESFNQNHGGDLDIHVYLCDYNLGEIIREKGMFPRLKIKTHDLFIDHYCFDNRKLSGQLKAEQKLLRKFICLNFRYEPVREAVVAYLYKKGFARESYISFFHHHNSQEAHKLWGLDTNEIVDWGLIKEGISEMQGCLPMTLDTLKSRALDPGEVNIPDYHEGQNSRPQNRISAFYKSSFVALVNETRYSTPAGSLSEKTFNPILYGLPVIILGGPHMLRYLREMGFKTFHSFWDESYDEILDPAQRLNAVLKLVDQIASYSYEELQELRADMLPVLRFNQNHWQNGFIPRRVEEIKNELRMDH